MLTNNRRNQQPSERRVCYLPETIRRPRLPPCDNINRFELAIQELFAFDDADTLLAYVAEETCAYLLPGLKLLPGVWRRRPAVVVVLRSSIHYTKTHKQLTCYHGTSKRENCLADRMAARVNSG